VVAGGTAQLIVANGGLVKVDNTLILSPPGRMVDGQEVRSYIEHEWNASHLGRGVGGGGGKGVQDAHEAIRPTRPQTREPQGLEAEQARLYALIWARFAASQMAPSLWRRLKLAGEASGWSAAGKTEWRTFAGWEAAYAKLVKPVPQVPPLAADAKGDTLALDQCELIEAPTKPPARNPQHGLVAKMKAEGIGRPSTYAETIRKLLDREYARDEKGRLYATEAGCTLWENVAPCYGTTTDGIFSTAFTAGMEVQLEHIEGGETVAAQAWQEFADHFNALHSAALERKKERATPRQLAYLQSLAAQAGAEAEPLLVGKVIEELDGEAVGAHRGQGRPRVGETGWLYPAAGRARQARRSRCVRARQRRRLRCAHGRPRRDRQRAHQRTAGAHRGPAERRFAQAGRLHQAPCGACQARRGGELRTGRRRELRNAHWWPRGDRQCADYGAATAVKERLNRTAIAPRATLPGAGVPRLRFGAAGARAGREAGWQLPCHAGIPG